MNEFVAYLSEVFETLGPIGSRPMFGGHGIYYDDLMIGLVADHQLYLKADSESIPEFTALALPPFEYNKAGKAMTMSYYLAPETIFDDRNEALRWGKLAHAAALRSRKK